MTGKRRWRDERTIVTIVLTIAALILFAISFFTKDKETTRLLRLIGYVLVLANIILRLFKGTFGYKPTRNEIEERVFGKKN